MHVGMWIRLPLALDHCQMYVPGKVKDCDNFICDIGTGYYVEKVSFHFAVSKLSGPKCISLTLDQRAGPGILPKKNGFCHKEHRDLTGKADRETSLERE